MATVSHQKINEFEILVPGFRMIIYAGLDKMKIGTQDGKPRSLFYEMESIL
jgi:hypothetical protein